MTRVATLLCLALCCAAWPTPGRAQVEAIPLNDYQRLGQRFTVSRPVKVLIVQVPSWSDNEGGLTLRVWDSPERRKLLAAKKFEDIRDNEGIMLQLPRALPPGSYYWEVSDRTGVTRVGLYAEPVAPDTQDCAYADGTPMSGKRFRFSTTVLDTYHRHPRDLEAILRSNAPVTEKIEACRELAVVGDAKSVPVLAGLLGNRALAHMARYALEPLPYPAVDAALRTAAGRLQGELLIGVLNSIGVRRDPKAVALLARVGRAGDARVREAAWNALGRIGTTTAADALSRALKESADDRAVAAEACLECARVLAASGKRREAAALCEEVLAAAPSGSLRTAAMVGLLTALGSEGAGRWRTIVQSGTPEELQAVLWAVPRVAVEPKVTQEIAGVLETLPTDRAELLARALGDRGDPAAVPALARALSSEDEALRRSAAAALAQLGGEAAVRELARLAVARGSAGSEEASEALGMLRFDDAGLAARMLLSREDPEALLAGIAIVRARSLAAEKERLFRLARHTDAGVRSAALGALQVLVHAGDVTALLELMPSSQADADLEAIETALSAAVQRRRGDADPVRALAEAANRLSGRSLALILRVLGSAGGPAALAAVEKGLTSTEPEVRESALETLCAWQTADAAPILLRAARAETGTAAGLRCLRAALRLAASTEASADARLAICREAGPIIVRDEERRLLLGALGGIPSLDALDMAARLMDVPAVQAEACQAVVAIAGKLGPQARDPRVLAALEKASSCEGAPDIARQAAELLAALRKP